MSKGEESGIVGLAATEYISFYPANRNQNANQSNISMNTYRIFVYVKRNAINLIWTHTCDVINSYLYCTSVLFNTIISCLQLQLSKVKRDISKTYMQLEIELWLLKFGRDYNKYVSISENNTWEELVLIFIFFVWKVSIQLKDWLIRRTNSTIHQGGCSWSRDKTLYESTQHKNVGTNRM